MCFAKLPGEIASESMASAAHAVGPNVFSHVAVQGIQRRPGRVDASNTRLGKVASTAIAP
jgi:hypothetical protein